MKINRIIFQVITGIAIIAFILHKIGIKEVLSVLDKTDPVYFIMACLSYLTLNIVLAVRLRYLLMKIRYLVKFPDVFFSHMGGMMVGDLTPGRSGYFFTPSLLKKKADISITDGMACIFAPQAIEFILKVGGAVAAIVFLSTRSGIRNDLLISAGIGAALLLFVGIGMLTVSWKNENISIRFLNKIPFLSKFTENLLSFKDKSVGLKENIKAILLLTMIGWFFAALHWSYLGKALGIELPYLVFFLLHPLLTILMFVPATPAGFGLMESGVVIVLSLFTISPATALAFSFLIRISITLVDLFGLGSVLSSLGNIKL
jgi:uncharacterized protein (TIRG00374 family)